MAAPAGLAVAWPAFCVWLCRNRLLEASPMSFPAPADFLAITDPVVLLTGLMVFASRICDVSIGTIRTIVTVQGRTLLAFTLAVFEVSIWISVVSTVILQVQATPVLVVFYSLGYATGNVVGILVERRLAFGMIILKVFSHHHGEGLAELFRRAGQPVTLFQGEGMKGPVTELYLACRRRDLKWLLTQVSALDKEAFYVVEQAREISQSLKSVSSLGGWRQRRPVAARDCAWPEQPAVPPVAGVQPAEPGSNANSRDDRPAGGVLGEALAVAGAKTYH
jgi:uncharacterized protein YebE (UPF0316 family)